MIDHSFSGRINWASELKGSGAGAYLEFSSFDVPSGFTANKKYYIAFGSVRDLKNYRSKHQKRYQFVKPICSQIIPTFRLRVGPKPNAVSSTTAQGGRSRVLIYRS